MRLQTTTQKLSVEGFDPIYLHLDCDHAGRPVGVRISAPGKYRDQALGKLFDGFSDQMTDMLQEAS